MAEFAQLASVQALATALLHFLWQGSLIALAAAALMRAARTASARYTIGIGALVAMLAAPAITFTFLVRTDSNAAASAVFGSPRSPPVERLRTSWRLSRRRQEWGRSTPASGLPPECSRG